MDKFLAELKAPAWVLRIIKPMLPVPPWVGMEKWVEDAHPWAVVNACARLASAAFSGFSLVDLEARRCSFYVYEWLQGEPVDSATLIIAFAQEPWFGVRLSLMSGGAIAATNVQDGQPAIARQTAIAVERLARERGFSEERVARIVYRSEHSAPPFAWIQRHDPNCMFKSLPYYLDQGDIVAGRVTANWLGDEVYTTWRKLLDGKLPTSERRERCLVLKDLALTQGLISGHVEWTKSGFTEVKHGLG